MTTVEDVVGTSDRLMGVKAVWGRSREAVMCFGAREERYSTVRGVARRAISSPFLITIGGGAQATPDIEGKALELIRLTGAFGETSAFVTDPGLRERLQQWPVAVMALDVYSIDGEPHLEADLGFPDRKILANAFDGVKNDVERIPLLWSALKGRAVVHNIGIAPPSDFADPGKLQACGSTYPKRKITSQEGALLINEARLLERDPRFSKYVKQLNASRNRGSIVCEGCDLSDARPSLFDAHHLDPLCSGPRKSMPSCFAVLCPTCHRWAHALGSDKLKPLSVAEIRAARKTSPTENSN